MEKQKRKVRSYKITDKDYLKAMKRADKEKKSLATMVEVAVADYGSGKNLSLMPNVGDVDKLYWK